MTVEGRFGHLFPGRLGDHLGDLETQRDRNTLRDDSIHRGHNMHGKDLEPQRDRNTLRDVSIHRGHNMHGKDLETQRDRNTLRDVSKV